MKLKEFENKLLALDSRFSMRENPNNPGLSNVFFNGQNYDLPVVSSTDIPDVVTPGATYTFPNGASARLWAYPEIEARLQAFLKMVEAGNVDEEYAG